MRYCFRSDWLGAVALCGAVVIALALRLPHLDHRPMHNDEANQAYKAGILMDTGSYRYDPVEHHGPTLYYLTLPGAYVQAGGRFADTTVATYRLVPVFFSIVVILLLWGGRDALGRTGVVVAGYLTAVSPVMVYFSRFYIQEMLLVCFTFALLLSLWRYHRCPGVGWAIAIGVSAGLMHATKETCVLAWGSMAAAAALLALFQPAQARLALQRLSRQHVVVTVLAALVVSVLFFSSFLSNWRGPLDSVLTYGTYLQRAGASATTHDHPWWFYLRLLAYQHPVQRLRWGEDLIYALAVIGAAAAWFKPTATHGSVRALRFLSLYTLLLTAIYAAIPYKTPWCVLSFWHGWILLAGAGAHTLIVLPRWRWVRVGIGIALAAGMVQLGQRATLAAQRYAANQRNPYAYAQTSTDFRRLVEHVEHIAAVHPEGKSMRIHVIAPADMTWPLPWSLRRYPNCGYWLDIAPEALAGSPAVIITTADILERLSPELCDAYTVEYYGLRPDALLCGLFEKEAWARFVASRSQQGPDASEKSPAAPASGH